MIRRSGNNGISEAKGINVLGDCSSFLVGESRARTTSAASESGHHSSQYSHPSSSGFSSMSECWQITSQGPKTCIKLDTVSLHQPIKRFNRMTVASRTHNDLHGK
jgi:hypothetical protein